RKVPAVVVGRGDMQRCRHFRGERPVPGAARLESPLRHRRRQPPEASTQRRRRRRRRQHSGREDSLSVVPNSQWLWRQRRDPGASTRKRKRSRHPIERD
ncbi:unnamed protein product, partial [Ectocarpus sp. 8 AP-2014]